MKKPAPNVLVRLASLLLAMGLVLGCRTSAQGDAGPAPARSAAAPTESTPPQNPSVTVSATGGAPVKVKDMTNYQKPSDKELRERLSPIAYEVTQHDATEPPFQNAFWNNHEAGLYVDVTTGEPLFSSRDKFDSGTGWPSFTRPVDDARVLSKTDKTHGMTRTEVRSRAGNAHLGHVFDDGPRPTGLRFCINSASLRFIPLGELDKAGYGAYAPLVSGDAHEPSAEDTQNSCAAPAPGEAPGCETTLETALLAGGCFWGMEDILRKVPGVLETEVGYTGGTTKNPTYETVKRGDTGHAESIRIVFDPKKISYAELLEKWFFRMHDPTTVDRQGNDRGSQYRSAIFVLDEEQRRVAEAVKAKVDKSGKWGAPIVTQIVAAGPFTPAESYHQDYLEEHPGGYTCHFLRD